MDIKSELNASGFRFQKRFGQNFITDTNFLKSIAEKSGVTSSDTVVEIGAGAGTLTAAIAERAKRVIAFEIDESLKPVLEKTLSAFDNVELVFGDFMDVKDLSERTGEKYKVIANLPYYITTPVLFKLMEDTKYLPQTISVMVQKEVADRMCAKPSTKDYGALTVAIDARFSARKLVNVSRDMFYPVPNVDSAVVLMTAKDACDGVDMKKFSALVRAAFAMRRKTLINNLTAAFSLSRAACEQALTDCGLPLAVRGEALCTEQFKALTKRLFD